MKLGDIAAVRSGLVLSRKQAREPSGIRYPLLNLRSINSGGYIDLGLIDIFEASGQLSQEYLSQPGDVVVRMSSPYTAVLFDNSTAGMVISSNFVIIRCNRKELLPEYLFWLINTPEVKRTIYENTSSNMLGAVKAKYFMELDVAPISLDGQRQLAAINTLAKREATLLRRLASEKERYYNFAVRNIYQKFERGK